MAFRLNRLKICFIVSLTVLVLHIHFKKRKREKIIWFLMCFDFGSQAVKGILSYIVIIYFDLEDINKSLQTNNGNFMY